MRPDIEYYHQGEFDLPTNTDQWSVNKTMLVAMVTTASTMAMLVGQCDVILIKPGKPECVRLMLVATRVTTG